MLNLNLLHNRPHTCHFYTALTEITELLECQACQARKNSYGRHRRGSQLLRVKDPTTGQGPGRQPLSDAADWEYHPQQNSYRTRARLQLQRLREYPDLRDLDKCLRITVVWQRTVCLGHGGFINPPNTSRPWTHGRGCVKHRPVSRWPWSQTGPVSGPRTYCNDQPLKRELSEIGLTERNESLSLPKVIRRLSKLG